MEHISVIGAGTMGNGIAHHFAMHDYPVVLVDVDSERLEKALLAISGNLDRQAAKGLLDPSRVPEVLSRIRISTDLPAAVSGADLIIEAASENLSVKLSLFQRMDALAPAACILASNTSSLSITKLASETSRPSQVIGMHFMNPVPVMKLVEVIRGFETSAGVTDAICELAKKTGKVPCVVNDYPGFIANRVLMPMINEAIYALHEGVAGVESIDLIMKLGMAHPMGPLQLADYIGLDTCLAILKVLEEGFGSSKFSPCPLLLNMVNAGELGVKTGHGFYSYGEKTKQLKVSDRFLA